MKGKGAIFPQGWLMQQCPPNVSFAKDREILEGIKLLLIVLGRDVRVVRGWGILVLGDEGVRRSVKRYEGLLAGLRVKAYC